jgi:16S rRNA (uracil1498-N3)-methyltransferase
MRRALCEHLLADRNSLVEIPDHEAKHLISVLRLGPGEEVELLDGKGFCARGTLVFRNKKVFAELIELPKSDPRLLSLPLHLHMSILKGEAMEWVVEKAVELGVRTLTPIETEFTVVKIHKKGAETCLERWQRIADQALKQCGRLDRMEIRSPRSPETIDSSSIPVFWLDESLAANGNRAEHLSAMIRSHPPESGGGSALLVGPEGGFSASERRRLLELTVPGNKGIKRVHLGSLILRAETAALFGVSIMVGEAYGKE